MAGKFLAIQQDRRWRLEVATPKKDSCSELGYELAIAGSVTNYLELESRFGPKNGSPAHPLTRLTRLLAQNPTQCIEALKGGFTIVLIHRETGMLWAKRDRLGNHSLYLSTLANGRGWVLGHSAADVFRASRHRFSEDPAYMAGLFSLSGHTPVGHSPFASVQALLPGELLTIKGSRIHRTRTPVDMAQPRTWAEEAEAVEQFRSLLCSSIGNCLADDSDTALMLSGGLDSAPLGVIGDRICQSKKRKLIPVSWSLKAFPKADESIWVNQLADILAERLTRFDCSHDLPFGSPESSPVNPEAPYYNAYRPAINRCYQTAANSGCSVILNGSAGDELYPNYRWLYRGYLANGEWPYLLNDLKGSFAQGGARALWRKAPLRELFKHHFNRLRWRNPPPWLNAHGTRHWTPHTTWPPECQDHPVPEFAEQLFGFDMASGLAIEYFQALALGVERRDPYQNEELALFMLNAPFSFHIRNHQTKWIMREAMRGTLPEPLRVKRRTGLLDSYYLAGRQANRAVLEDFLFKWRTDWQRWIRPEAVRATLADENVRGAKPLLVDQAIGYVNWLRYWET